MDILKIILPFLAIVSCMVFYNIGRAQGFKDGFETAKRVYHQYLD